MAYSVEQNQAQGKSLLQAIRSKRFAIRSFCEDCLNKTTVVLALVGIALRLFIIFPGPFESKVNFFVNQADLRNYYWPAQAALRGQNPYVLWATGQSGEFRADMAPLELAVYVATAAIWNDPRAIQILFAIFDIINIVLLGALLKQSPLRLPFQIFYALGPLTLYNLVFVSEDKTILLTLTFFIFYLLLLPKDYVFRFRNMQLTTAPLIILLAAVLASFKWLSVFYLLPLLLFVSRDWRDFIKYGALFGIIVGVSHLPWVPDWLIVYTFRFGRVVSPMHISVGVVLNAIGLYDKTAMLILVIIALLAIYALFWFRRIDIFETMALSVMAGVLWTPDMDPVHLSIVVIYFLLIVDWTNLGRLATVWLSSAWVAAVYALSTRTGFARYGVPDPRSIVGSYGSLQMVILSYVLFVAVLVFYLLDKRHGGAVGQRILAKVD